MDLHIKWQRIENAFPGGYIHQMKFDRVATTASRPASLASVSPVDLSPARYFTTKLGKEDEGVHDTMPGVKVIIQRQNGDD